MQIHLGIDVAKAKLDCALRLANSKHRNKVVENTSKGFKALMEWLAKQGVQDECDQPIRWPDVQVR